jgi:predicted phosphoadenosine phosphosulfate sulfurtransferase
VAEERGETPVRTVFWDEEAIPQETVEYVRRVGQDPRVALEWYCLPIQHRNACSRSSPYWWPWAPEARDLWVRPLPPEALTELEGFPMEPPSVRPSAPRAAALLCRPERGRVAMLMGIRAEESLMRQRSVTRRVEDNYIVVNGDCPAGNVSKVYPVYDWKTADVWTAPKLFGWDYNRAYDIMEMAGVKMTDQRCSPAFGEEPLEKLWTYATCFPDVWDRMLERVPGVGAAYRYARTELYAYGGVPDPPPGVSWQDHILEVVSRHDPDVQNKVVAGIRDKIARHYRQTTDPILPTARHPMTGMSWRRLYMLASRGDLKNRKDTTPGEADRERLAAKYNEERSRLGW